MRILALETTEAIGTVAAMLDGDLVAEQSLDTDLRSARSLAPGIQRLLKTIGWRPIDVDLVAVTIGPGSFTGLRVGVTTAKTFAYAVGADIIGIDTLEAIAAGVPDEIDAVTVVLDAQRRELTVATFRRDDSGRFRAEAAERIVATTDFLADPPPDTVLAGPILRKLRDHLPDGTEVVDEAYWAPRASVVARLAAMEYAAGRRDDLYTLAPKYSRRAAAEEVLERRQASREE